MACADACLPVEVSYWNDQCPGLGPSPWNSRSVARAMSAGCRTIEEVVSSTSKSISGIRRRRTNSMRSSACSRSKSRVSSSRSTSSTSRSSSGVEVVQRVVEEVGFEVVLIILICSWCV